MKKSKRAKKENFLGAPAKPVSIPIVSLDEPKKSGGKLSMPFIVGAFVVLFVILAAAGVYVFAITREDVAIPNTANLELAQLQQLMDNLGELIQIPEGEAPIMALVSDASTLKDQPFFKNAQNGDRVIIFKSNKQAILYRASTNKIIAATFISDQELESFQKLTQANQPASSQSAELAASPMPAEKIKTVVLNSTQEAGLARKGANLLDEQIYDVVSTSNSEGEYEETLIVNVSKAASVTAQVLEGIASSMPDIEAKIGNLPPDEAAPAGADVVVILGSDFSSAY